MNRPKQFWEIFRISEDICENSRKTCVWVIIDYGDSVVNDYADTVLA